MAKKRSKKYHSQRVPYRDKQRKQVSFSFWGRIFKWGFTLAVWGGIILTAAVILISLDLPNIDSLSDKRKPVVKILAIDGSTLGTYGDLYGNYVEFNQIPPYLIGAVVATEDRRFFEHFGIDPWGMGRAMVTNLLHGRIKQGGSTITQQLAKIGFLTQKRTFKRKLQEVMLALYLEHKYTKDQILTMYLNRVYLGAGNYGVDAAAHYYFGKSVSDLNLYECAMIAGLIKAPSRYAPSVHPKDAAKRAAQVLDNMADAGVLYDPSVAKEAYKMPPIVANAIHKRRIAPYFTDWVMEQLPDYIGNIDQDITVYTTIDPTLQDYAEEAITHRMSIEGNSHNAGQAAMVVMTPEGGIRAMVGGKSYAQSEFNRVTQAKRQPGSSFKAFVYTTAFEQGYKPDDIMTDEAVEYADWSPENYKHEYKGDITLKTAFADSVNTIAVKLAQKTGIRNVINTARRLGVTSDIRPNLSSALGSSSLSLLELTGAYAHFANNGEAVWVHGINKIQAGDTVIYERDAPSHIQVLAPNIVAEMNQLLLDTVEDGTGKNAALSRDVGGKTGTSQNYRDAWFIGFTPDYVTGVWYGNDDDSPMRLVTGGGLPARTWKNFMQNAETGMPVSTIPTTADAVTDAREEQNGGSFWKRLFGSNSNSTDSKRKDFKLDVQYDYPTENKR